MTAGNIVSRHYDSLLVKVSIRSCLGLPSLEYQPLIPSLVQYDLSTDSFLLGCKAAVIHLGLQGGYA